MLVQEERHWAILLKRTAKYYIVKHTFPQGGMCMALALAVPE